MAGGLKQKVAFALALEVPLQALDVIPLGIGETGGIDRHFGAEDDERRRISVHVRADDVVRFDAG